MASLFGAILRLERSVGRLEPLVERMAEHDARLTRVERVQWAQAGAWALVASGLLWSLFGGPKHDAALAPDTRRTTAEVRPVPVPE